MPHLICLINDDFTGLALDMLGIDLRVIVHRLNCQFGASTSQTKKEELYARVLEGD